MKINIKIIAGVLIMLATAVLAIPILPFPGWEEVKRKSTDIIIVRCVKSESPSDSFNGLLHADIVVTCVLKGRDNGIKSHCRSLNHLRSDEYYAIFSLYHDGVYDAIENYRVIPLGAQFQTNLIAGKPLDDQIQMLLQRRVDDLNRQMEENQREKERLEEGLKK